MTVVTVHEAKTHLSRLLAEVEAGKEVIVARGKRPVARIVPIERKPKRVPGKYKGEFTVPPEFFEPLSDEDLKLWEGGDGV